MKCNGKSYRQPWRASKPRRLWRWARGVRYFNNITLPTPIAILAINDQLLAAYAMFSPENIMQLATKCGAFSERRSSRNLVKASSALSLSDAYYQSFHAATSASCNISDAHVNAGGCREYLRLATSCIVNQLACQSGSCCSQSTCACHNVTFKE